MIWRDVFMPLVLRAFKKIHYNYGIWGLGQQVYGDFEVKNINHNHGLLIANESAVCDAITQEIINSPLTNGANLTEEVRYYSVFREMSFSFDKKSSNTFEKYSNKKQKKKKIVDLVINRYKLTERVRKISQIPVLIEAKRYHYFTPNIITGNPSFQGVNEIPIKDDISYLRQIKNGLIDLEFDLKRIKPTDVFIYVLFWGLLNKEDNFRDHPEDIITNKFNGLLRKEDCLFEYLPIKWIGTSVTDWVWICLCQIDFKERLEESPFINLTEIADD